MYGPEKAFATVLAHLHITNCDFRKVRVWDDVRRECAGRCCMTCVTELALPRPSEGFFFLGSRTAEKYGFAFERNGKT